MVLGLSQSVLGMRWKERMGDTFDPNLVFEPLGDFQPRSLVLPHSDIKGGQGAKDKEAVERRGDRASVSLNSCQLFMKCFQVHEESSHDHVRVPVQILGT